LRSCLGSLTPARPHLRCRASPFTLLRFNLADAPAENDQVGENEEVEIKLDRLARPQHQLAWKPVDLNRRGTL